MTARTVTPQSSASRKAVVQALSVSAARCAMAPFVLYTLPNYQMGWVHETICRELDDFLAAVLRQESPRLMICMPPRHGKTELASRRFPAYAFGRNPDISIISTSYAADLASRNNRDVQRVIDSPRYHKVFPEVALWGKNVRTVATGSYQRNSDIFEIVGRKGSYRSAGVGGGITGMGGDILIVDDPFKDRKSANSPAIRRTVWEWYTSTLYTRLAPGGGLLVINTRWHMDDLSGRLLEQARSEGDAWRLVNFPAIATADEEHRKAGEALHPERYPLPKLEGIRKAIGSRDWEALYQQHPTPDGGTIFMEAWVRYYFPRELPERFERVILSWDMAFKDGHEVDYVVGQVWGKKGAEFYLLDQVRARLSFTATLKAFRALARKWPQASRKLVEDKANGPAVIDSLKKTITGIIPVEPRGGKAARAHAVTPLFEAGNVLLPHPQWCPWIKDYVAELTQFPGAAHDDQVDATSQALTDLTGRQALKFNSANSGGVSGQPTAGQGITGIRAAGGRLNALKQQLRRAGW